MNSVLNTARVICATANIAAALIFGYRDTITAAAASLVAAVLLAGVLVDYDRRQPNE